MTVDEVEAQADHCNKKKKSAKVVEVSDCVIHYIIKQHIVSYSVSAPSREWQVHVAQWRLCSIAMVQTL